MNTNVITLEVNAVIAFFYKVNCINIILNFLSKTTTKVYANTCYIVFIQIYLNTNTIYIFDAYTAYKKYILPQNLQRFNKLIKIKIVIQNSNYTFLNNLGCI